VEARAGFRAITGRNKAAVSESVGLFDAAGWWAMLDDALRQTGGSVTKAERDWADALLRPPERKQDTSGKNGAA